MFKNKSIKLLLILILCSAFLVTSNNHLIMTHAATPSKTILEWFDGNVVIADKVAESLGLANGSAKVTQTDLETVTDLDLSGADLAVLPSLDLLKNLNWLCINDTNISSIVSLNLPNLRWFDARNTKLTELPSLDNAIRLTTLDLSSSPILSIPNLNNNTGLVYLTLNETQIEVLPPLDNLIQLEALNINNTNVSNLPSLNLPSLIWFDAANTKLTELPSLDNAVKLRGVNISNSPVTSIPSLNNNVELRYLTLPGTQIEILPSLDNLIWLEELNASNTNLSVLPGLNLPNLIWFDAVNTKLTELPSLDNAIKLMGINISNSPVTSIPNLNNNVELRYLTLLGTQIEVLPPLDNLIWLKALNISNTNVSNLPSLNLPNLIWLDAVNTKLTELPSLDNAINLASIDASRSPITSIPSLDKNTQLSWINFNNTQVSVLPSLSNNINLEGMEFENTKLSNIPSLSNNTKLFYINASNTKLTDLPDFKNYTISATDLYFKNIDFGFNQENYTKSDLENTKINMPVIYSKMISLSEVIGSNYTFALYEDSVMVEQFTGVDIVGNILEIDSSKLEFGKNYSINLSFHNGNMEGIDYVYPIYIEYPMVDISIDVNATMINHDPNTSLESSSSMSIKNNSSVGVNVNLKKMGFASDSEWKPNLVSHIKRQFDEWKNLNLQQSFNEALLGLRWGGEADHGWSEELTDNPGGNTGAKLDPINENKAAGIWVDNQRGYWTLGMVDKLDSSKNIDYKELDIDTPYKLGFIEKDGNAKIYPTITTGPSFLNPKNFKIEIVLEVTP